MRRILSFVVAGLAVTTAACDDGTGVVENHSPVTVQFGTAGLTALSAATPASASLASLDELRLTGSDGAVLTITDIRLIVSELELEADDGACDLAVADDDDCPEFEAPASFVDLPLGTGTVEVATTQIPFGTYTELEFEVEDVSFDDDDEDEDELATVREEVLAAYPNWPDEASMVVTGTFDPDPNTAEDERSFTVFFEAEIEVEQEFATPLVVDETGANQVVTVNVVPAAWFVHADGTVEDLSAHDFETTGDVVEFELEFEDGLEAELGDDDDDDDD